MMFILHVHRCGISYLWGTMHVNVGCLFVCLFVRLFMYLCNLCCCCWFFNVAFFLFKEVRFFFLRFLSHKIWPRMTLVMVGWHWLKHQPGLDWRLLPENWIRIVEGLPSSIPRYSKFSIFTVSVHIYFFNPAVEAFPNCPIKRVYLWY